MDSAWFMLSKVWLTFTFFNQQAMVFIQICLFLLINLHGCSSLRELQSSPSPTPPPPPQQHCDYNSQSCGGLQIPYPFGMSDGCGLPQYRIVCKQNASYGDGDLPFLQIGTPATPELQVLAFQTRELVANSTHLKAMPSPQYCNQVDVGNASVELRTGGPFILAENNWFVVVGCYSSGACTADTIEDARNQTTVTTTLSCTNSCYNQFVLDFCNSYTCCINPIPPHSWKISFNGTGIAYKLFPGLCGFSMVLTPSTYMLPSNEVGFFAAGHYGLSLSWALPRLDSQQNCSILMQRADYACHAKATCLYNGYLQSYNCNCTKGYRGDGYKAGIGCQDINECEEHLDNCEEPPLGTCINTNGSFICKCTAGGGSGLRGTCPAINSSQNVLVPAIIGGLVGAGILAGILVFVCTIWITYRKRKKRRENFHRAGGDQLKSYLFSERELHKATDSFSKNHVIGEGGFGEVYWGILSTERGKRKVAIKKAKPKAVDQQMAQMQSFVKEILLLSKTVHRNVVELLGCCVETSVPLLVFEYVESGNLRDFLGKDSSALLPRSRRNSLWAWRLHVAVQTAEALSYLHDQYEPIFHLDLKPLNILIDKHYSPKVADFGLSCFLTTDATHLTNPIMAGTFGYVDPEYGYSFRVTDKYDVFSFGVILLELVSAQPAFGPTGVLAHQFSTNVNMEEEVSKHANRLPSFIDSRLESDAEVLACIQEVAKVARSCVAMKGSERPSMQEVYHQLKQVQLKHPSCDWKHKSSGGHGFVEKSHEAWQGGSNHCEESPLVFDEDISDQSTASASSLFTPYDNQGDESKS